MAGLVESVMVVMVGVSLGACGDPPPPTGEGSEGTADASSGGTEGSSDAGPTQGTSDGSSSETGSPPGACVYEPGACDPICLPDPVLDALVHEALALAPDDVITPELATSLTFIGSDPETDVGSLDGLECFPNLTVIVFRVDSFTDIEPITGLSQVQDLIIEDVPVAEITRFAALDPIQLWLNRTEVQDVSALAGSSLEELHVDGSPISDLGVVAELPLLTTLHASGTLVSDLSPVAAAPSLFHAELHDCQITDLSPLAGNTQLYALGLRNNQISELAPLATTNVEWLWIDGNPVSDLSPLSSLAQLAYLTIADTQVTDLAPLVALPIESFAVDRAPLADPQQLWALPGLRDVSAAGIGLTSLEGVSLALEQLLVADNALTDVSPVVDLSLLIDLDLASNEITDLGAIEAAPIFGAACNRFGVTDNPLDAYSTDTVLPALCDAGIIVESDALACDQLDNGCGPID